MNRYSLVSNASTESTDSDRSRSSISQNYDPYSVWETFDDGPNEQSDKNLIPEGKKKWHTYEFAGIVCIVMLVLCVIFLIIYFATGQLSIMWRLSAIFGSIGVLLGILAIGQYSDFKKKQPVRESNRQKTSEEYQKHIQEKIARRNRGPGEYVPYRY